MRRSIKDFPDGSSLEFDQGRIDEWCIYFQRDGCPRTALRDQEIFERLLQLGASVGTVKLYQEYISIFELTDRDLSQSVLAQITAHSSEYFLFPLECDFLLTYLYAGMIAEENKKDTKLGKRVKRLGVHQVLIEERSAEFAANFSRGKRWAEIQKECEVRGF